MLYKLLYGLSWSIFVYLTLHAFYHHGEDYLRKELKKLSSQYARDHNLNCINEDIDLLRKLFFDVYQTSISLFRATIILLGVALYGTVLVGGIIFFT